MSSDQDKRKKLLSDLFFKRIPEERFLEEFGATRGNIGSIIGDMLRHALESRDPQIVEDAIPLMYRFGIRREYLDSLNSLALEPWHRRHEDVVFALGKLRDPGSIGILALTAAAKHPYLEDDEAFALGTKSIHALANIGTREAVERMGELARTGNEVLAKTAVGLLREIASSGNDLEAQMAARSRLDNLG